MAETEFKITIIVDPSRASAGVAPVKKALDETTKSAEKAEKAAQRILPARDAQGRFQKIGEEVKKVGANADKARQQIERFLKGLALAVAINEAKELVDAYTNIQNRIKSVTQSAQEQSVVNNEVFKAAQDVGVEYENLAESYARIKRATTDLGVSQRESIEITETLAKALKLSGATGAETSSVMLQLSQALSSGRLQGDEFRSVSESGRLVMELFAKQLGVTVGELKKLSKEGKITSEVMVQALTKGADTISAQFTERMRTMNESLIRVKNEAIKFLGELATRSGALGGINDALALLVDHFETIAKVAIAASEVLIGIFVGKAIAAVITGLRSLAIAAATNPFTALAVGIGIALALAIQFSDELGEIVTKMGQISIKDRGTLAASGRSNLAGLNTLSQRASSPAVTKEVKDASDLVTLFGGLDAARKKAKEDFNRDLEDAVKLVEKFAATTAEAATRSFIEIASQLRSDKFKAITDNLTKVAGDFSKKLKEITDKELLDRKGKNTTPQGLDPKEIEKRRKAFEALEGRAFAVSKALNELKNDETVLNKAIAAGLTTRERANEILAQRKIQLRNELDPLREIIEAMQKEQNLLKLGEERRAATIRLDTALTALRKDGIQVSFAETAALLQQVNATEAALKAEERRKALKETNTDLADQSAQIRLQVALLGQRKEVQNAALRTQQIEQQFARQRIPLTREQTEALEDQVLAQEKLQRAAEKTTRAFEQSAEQGVLRGLRAIRDEVTTIGDQVENVMVSAFNGIRESIVQLVVSGKADFADLINTILADLTRLALNQAFTSLITAVGSAAAGAASSGGSAPGFANGGSMVVGGSGPPDSQLLVARVTPGEKVDFTPPGQQQATAPAAAPPQVNVRNVNVLDPRQAVDAMASPEGERVQINFIRRNARAIRDILR